MVTPEIVWSSVAPALILMLGGILLLTVVSLVRRNLPSWFYATWTVAVATASIVATVPLWHRVQDSGASSEMAGTVGLDGFSLFVTGVIALSVILAALLLEGYLRREDMVGPEWYVLMLLSASGGVVMASANDLIVLFLGLEILSVAVYVLASMHMRRESSQEAGFKYFILGAFSSAFLLYGIAFVYGATGSTNLGRYPDIPGRQCADRQRSVARRAGVHAGGFRVQGRRSAVPHVGTGRLPGCPDPRLGLHGRRCEGGGVRRPAAGVRDGFRAHLP